MIQVFMQEYKVHKGHFQCIKLTEIMFIALLFSKKKTFSFVP